MQVCPNCEKRLKDNFEYCRVCGTKLDGGNPGDFATEMLNVFHHEDGFIYLFTEKGSQVVLEAGSIDELAFMANEKNYPWQFRDNSKNASSAKDVELVKTPRFENDFLRASSLKGPEVIPTSSTAKKVEAENAKSNASAYDVSGIVAKKDDFFSDIDFSKVGPKRNPSSERKEIPEDEISVEYGILGVFKKNGLWAYRTNEVRYDIVEKSLDNLKDRVVSKGASWQIVDEDLAGEALRCDRERIQKDSEEILKNRVEMDEFWQEKNQMTKSLNKRRNEELKERLNNHNIDNMLR